MHHMKLFFISYNSIVCKCRQATLRYRELNDGLETVQEKLRDARVSKVTKCLSATSVPYVGKFSPRKYNFAVLNICV